MVEPAEKISIVPATIGEREWCARLVAASEPWTTLGRTFDHCLAACAHPDYTLLVAHDGSHPCGFVLLHPRGVAGAPYIASLAVAPAARGKGTGCRLLECAEAQFPGAAHIFHCVSSFNTPARQLYERRGYAAVGVLNDYVMEGASEILMHKRLVRP